MSAGSAACVYSWAKALGQLVRSTPSMRSMLPVFSSRATLFQISGESLKILLGLAHQLAES